MRRRRGSGRFQAGSGAANEEINPMDGVANLADVMLVFACGIMMALITYWNVDVAGVAASTVDVQQGQEVTDVNGLGNDSSGQPLDDGGLEEYGKVYRDPVSGKLYMVTGGQTEAQGSGQTAGQS